MDTTDKDLQAEYNTRHKNLFHSMHGVFDKVDNALHNAFDEEQQPMRTTKDSVQTSSTLDHDYNDTTTAHHGFFSARSSAGGAHVTNRTEHVSNDEIKGEHQKGSIGYNINKSAMDAGRRDRDALSSADPEAFEPVGSKIEDTLGNTALLDDSLDPSAYHFPRRY